MIFDSYLKVLEAIIDNGQGLPQASRMSLAFLRKSAFFYGERARVQ
jgi:hypothetical protein